MASEQISCIANHEVHRLLEGSSSAITSGTTLDQTPKESDQGVSGLDNGTESANVEAALPNEAETLLLPLPVGDTVSSTLTAPADAPAEQLQLDDNKASHLQYDTQSELGHISVG
jgi:hypothetical protein